MKNYLAEVTMNSPYPFTFSYRIEARTQGRAFDFAWRTMRKEPRCKGKHETEVLIKIIPIK